MFFIVLQLLLQENLQVLIVS